MRKIFKSAVIVFIAVVLTGSFSGCSKAGTELSELMIIQGIGIDYSEGGYAVTVEMLNNRGVGSPDGSAGGEDKTLIYTSQGETVSQALRSLIVKSGNKPLFAHNRVIIIGENALNKGMGNLLDFFYRNYDSRASQLLCVAKGGSAKSVLTAPIVDGTVKSVILEDMLEESYNQSLVPRVRVIDAVNTIKSETGVLCVPSVSVINKGENSDYMVDGCCLFGRDETFSMYLSAEQSKGLAFLNNEIKKGFVTAEMPDGNKGTFVINKGKTRYKIGLDGGQLVYRLTINLSCDIDEIGGSEYFSTRDDFFEKLKNSISKSVCKTAENTIVALQGEYGGDAVNYGKRLQLSDKSLYTQRCENWQTEFKNTRTVICVNVTVRRIGEETFHSKKTG